MTKHQQAAKAHLDAVLDEALTRTFPASDPVAINVTHAEHGVFTDNTAANRFELAFANGTVVVEYQRSPGQLTIMHTDVPKALQGRGLANHIADLIVAEARRRGLRLVAVCPFFAAYMKKHPEHGDLLTPQA